MTEAAPESGKVPEHQFGLTWPGRLFPYQEHGVARLIDDPQVLLADEMGLGKTIQVLAAIRLLAAKGEGLPALIVAPVGVVPQWRRQLRQWAPELRPSTIVGTPEYRRMAWARRADVYLVAYDTLLSDIGIRQPEGPGQREWAITALDEAQRIKNAGTSVSVIVKRIKAKRRWAITGTPLENRLDDLISILDFVAPGRFEPAAKAIGLRRLLGEVQLRRRRADVLKDLPPKFSSTITLALGNRQRAAYDRARDEGLMHLGSLGRELRITHVLELILRLKQICNFCPATGESSKFDDLRDRIGTMVAGGEKALIFSQFVAEPFGARTLAAKLKSYEPLLLTGDLHSDERMIRIAEFERDARRRVLILSLRAGGVGLNLTAASHVFHFDRWWNPAVEAQAEDRTHRIGQERPVHVFAYLVEDTIEERIQTVLDEKRMLFADVIDGVDASSLGRLDLNTLIGLVRAA